MINPSRLQREPEFRSYLGGLSSGVLVARRESGYLANVPAIS